MILGAMFLDLWVTCLWVNSVCNFPIFTQMIVKLVFVRFTGYLTSVLGPWLCVGAKLTQNAMWRPCSCSNSSVVYSKHTVSANSSCPVGHYCPVGSDAPLRCDNGTYQDDETMVACKICRAGYFCDNTISIVILDNSTTICPAGSYCPEGTSFHNEWLCPIGTFNGVTGRQSASDCNPCLGGYYCPVAGMVAPVDFCDEGYFCKQGANISAPDQGKTLWTYTR